ncbi:hypothetical protein SAMN06265219_101488 [Gracilimonas mengyeensis]|uniref:Uncharacterized protein n=1 Tax=Gracilimonas mengyeensis TaxID=1302730 RepID=A0A521B0J4_9BACT|nr:hypothetical protein SAMN06265219_101488 [Gracilimonas mengyeensis]
MNRDVQHFQDSQGYGILKSRIATKENSPVLKGGDEVKQSKNLRPVGGNDFERNRRLGYMCQ